MRSQPVGEKIDNIKAELAGLEQADVAAQEKIKQLNVLLETITKSPSEAQKSLNEQLGLYEEHLLNLANDIASCYEAQSALDTIKYLPDKILETSMEIANLQEKINHTDEILNDTKRTLSDINNEIEENESGLIGELVDEEDLDEIKAQAAQLTTVVSQLEKQLKTQMDEQSTFKADLNELDDKLNRAQKDIKTNKTIKTVLGKLNKKPNEVNFNDGNLQNVLTTHLNQTIASKERSMARYNDERNLIIYQLSTTNRDLEIKQQEQGKILAQKNRIEKTLGEIQKNITERKEQLKLLTPENGLGETSQIKRLKTEMAELNEVSEKINENIGALMLKMDEIKKQNTDLQRKIKENSSPSLTRKSEELADEYSQIKRQYSNQIAISKETQGVINEKSKELQSLVNAERGKENASVLKISGQINKTTLSHSTDQVEKEVEKSTSKSSTPKLKPRGSQT